jgi:hypothetical protein
LDRAVSFPPIASMQAGQRFPAAEHIKKGSDDSRVRRDQQECYAYRFCSGTWIKDGSLAGKRSRKRGPYDDGREDYWACYW